MKFGERLKELRLERALSQKALADLSGMTERTIQNYEIAGMLPKRRETYERLAAALGVDVSVLLGEDEAFALAANTRYGSRVCRHGRSRAFVPYHPRSAFTASRQSASATAPPPLPVFSNQI